MAVVLARGVDRARFSQPDAKLVGGASGIHAAGSRASGGVFYPRDGGPDGLGGDPMQQMLVGVALYAATVIVGLLIIFL